MAKKIIKQVNIPSQEDIFKNTKLLDAARDMVVDLQSQVASIRKNREELWDDCYKVYRQVHKTQAYKGRSNIYIPSGFQAVENLSPRIILSLFASNPFFSLKPRQGSANVQAWAYGKVMEAQFEKGQFFWNMLNFVKQQGIYGRGRAKVYWREEDRLYTCREMHPGPVVDPITGQMIGVRSEIQAVQKRRSVFSAPFFRTVDPFMLYEDPWASAINGPDACSFVIEKIFQDDNHIKDWENRGFYKNLQNIGDIEKMNPIEELTATQIARAEATGIYIQNYLPKQPKKKYVLFEYWGAFDINEDGIDEECCITVLNKKRVIRLEVIPFWHGMKPYLDCPYIPLDGELEGIGIIEPIRDLVYEENDTHNQVMDNKTLILNCMWLMDENAGIRPSDLKMRPGGIIRTRDMGGLQPLRPSDFTAAGYNAFALLQKLIKEATGSTDPIMGVPTAGRQTATEISTLVGQGSLRTKLVNMLLEERVIKPYLMMAFSLNQQLLTQPVQVETDKGEIIEITRDKIYGEYDIKPMGISDIGQEQVKNNQMIGFFNLAAQYAPQIIPFVLEKIWQGFDFRDSETISKMLSEAAGPLAARPASERVLPENMAGMGSIADILKNVPRAGGPTGLRQAAGSGRTK